MEVVIKLLIGVLRLETAKELSSARRQPVTPPGGGARGAGVSVITGRRRPMARRPTFHWTLRPLAEGD